MYIPTSIKIILFKGKTNKQGLHPLMLKFTQNRKTNRIALRKWIKLEHWIANGSIYVKEKGKQSPQNAKALNRFLRAQLIRAEEILLNAERQNKSLSFPEFKTAFINLNDQNFLGFCEKEIERRTKSNYAYDTLKGYRAELNKLRTFKVNLTFSDLTLSFLQSYESYMHTKLGNKTNTIFSGMKFIKTMLNEARRKKLTDVDPFVDYKLVFKKDTREYLNAQELQKLQDLYDKKSLPDNYQFVLGYFLFACYTGLTWRDLEELTYQDIEQNENTWFIRKKRKKTENTFVAPLIETARQLIDLTQQEGSVFPKIYTNQKSNLYIKKAVEEVGIKKHVSFHVARHSFGTISMNYGIPQEVVQRMLGHSKSDMTKTYAKVLDSYVVSEMGKWDESLKSSNFLSRLSEEVRKEYLDLLERIKLERLKNGLSTLKMAEKIGVNERRYLKMEDGKVQFGVGEMMEIRRVLGKLDFNKI